MRTLTRWNPFREMARFDPFAEMNPFWRDLPMAGMAFEPEPMMRTDVSESDGGYLVKADLPGVAKEDIAVSIDGNVVSITAEIKREKEAKEGEKTLRTERYFGSMERSLTLPEDVDIPRATAAFENGVLTLTLPRAPGSEAKRLPIH